MKKIEAITRRQFVMSAAGACGAVAIGVFSSPAPASPARSPAFGLAINVFDMRRAADLAAGRKPDISDPWEFLKECQRLGADGIQGPLGVRDAVYTTRLQRFAEEHGLYIEASIPAPREAADVERFENEVVTAQAAGAQLARTVIFPGRRYEQFNSLAEFAEASRRAGRSLELAEPVVRRHKFRLAVENHKDQRIPERLNLLKRFGSEYVGMCVDVGNSFGLCEDPLEVVRAYAPLAFTVHLKDQAVREYDEGFLFADAPLGKGFLDVSAMVRLLREANPAIHFNIEVMTRDPLRVPVLTNKYWATMSDVPATELARTLRTVKRNASQQPLAQVSNLPIEGRVTAEARNITDSLAYARERLR